MPISLAIQNRQREFRSYKRGCIILASIMLKMRRRPKVTARSVSFALRSQPMIASLECPRLMCLSIAMCLVLPCRAGRGRGKSRTSRGLRRSGSTFRTVTSIPCVWLVTSSRPVLWEKPSLSTEQVSFRACAVNRRHPR